MYAGTPERKTEIRDDLLHLETRDGLGKVLVATHDIAPGTRLGAYGGKEELIVSSPTMHTVQLSESAHTNAFGGMEFASHCCRPNCILLPLFSGETKSSSNVIGLALVANKWIHAGASSTSSDGPGNELSRNTQQNSLWGGCVCYCTGELVTFDYNTSEWEVSCVFYPKCLAQEGHDGCRDAEHGVRGFAHLPRDEQRKILPICAPFIRQRAKEAHVVADDAESRCRNVTGEEPDTAPVSA